MVVFVLAICALHELSKGPKDKEEELRDISLRLENQRSANRLALERYFKEEVIKADAGLLRRKNKKQRRNRLLKHGR